MSQSQCTSGRSCADGFRSRLSRIDRWYSNLDPDSMGKLIPTVSVEGSCVVTDRPSDHLPLRMIIARRGGRRARRPAIPAEVANCIGVRFFRRK